MGSFGHRCAHSSPSRFRLGLFCCPFALDRRRAQARRRFFMSGRLAMLTVLLFLVPVIALVLIYGVALIVAVCRAKPEDVPQMIAQLSQVLRGLCGQLYRRRQVAGGDVEEEVQR